MIQSIKYLKGIQFQFHKLNSRNKIIKWIFSQKLKQSMIIFQYQTVRPICGVKYPERIHGTDG